ncbi:hypothetical protein BS47DRAFT_1388460 [Hydnum rufescens UP504]|uniref:Uncharacterized protein n=1 Tax=Hydnum rufescens UP504 TaxID=1448309 RepID=A0A9P6DY25_9AGAM|nr:hypothetical protein BS47DRAFT_1388460 [Hydnum rufescens UP504]
MPLLVLRNGHKLSLSTRTLGTLRCTRRFSFAPLFHPVTSLSHAYLDLGAACHSLPLPGFLPPYAAAIIGATVFEVYQLHSARPRQSRARVRRFKEIVMPLTLEAEREYGRELKRQSLASGKKIDKEAFEKFKAEIGPKLAKYRADLIKIYRCSPWPTFVVPTVLHVPLFIMISLSLREAAISPTPLLAETFLSEASLAQTDPYGIFPLAIGITSLDALDNAIRGVSVVMVGASMMAPNCVTLYWFTSTIYTLVQTVCFGLVDKGRERSRKTPPSLPEPPAQTAPKDASRPPLRVVYQHPRRPR